MSQFFVSGSGSSPPAGNITAGTATLVAGSANVVDANVLTTSIIVMSYGTPSGGATYASLVINSQSDGGFMIGSTGDFEGAVNYLVFN